MLIIKYVSGLFNYTVSNKGSKLYPPDFGYSLYTTPNPPR